MATKAEIILAATDRTQAAFASASRAIDGLKDRGIAAKASLAGIGGAIAGALALVQARGSIDVLDQLDDLQEKTGISVEKLSELRFAGESVGTPFEALAGGVGRLSKQMAEAAGGNKEAAATFKTLGIEVKNSDGTLRSSDAVLGDLADRFSTYEDGAGKAALAQRIFGKSGAEMIPFLNQGREGIEKLKQEAISLGAIYSGDLAKDAADFNDNLTKLKLSSEAAAISLGGPLIKSLVGITNQLLEARKEGGLLNALLITIGGGVARTLGVDEIGQVQSRANAATTEMQRLQGLMNGVELQLQRNPADEMAARRMETYRAKLQEQSKIASAASEQLKKLADIADPDGSGAKRREDRGFIPVVEAKKLAAPIIPSGGGGKAKDEEAAAKRYIESLQKRVEKAKELSEVEQTVLEIKRLQADGKPFTEQQKQEALLAAAKLDNIKEVEALQKDADEKNKERAEEQKRTWEEGVRLTQSLMTPAEAYAAALVRINELRDAGALKGDNYGRAVAKEAEAYTEAQKRIDDLANKADDFSVRAAGNIQDVLGQGLASSLDGDFKSIASNFGNMMKRMVAEAVAANLARAMFGSLVQGGSGSGLFGSLLQGVGAAFGGTSLATANAVSAANAVGTAGGDSLGTLATLLSGKRAAGGPVGANQTYLVGEEGPELFTPSMAGAIVPNHDLGGASSSISIVHAPVFQLDARADRASAMVEMQRIAAEANRQLIEQLKRQKVLPQ